MADRAGVWGGAGGLGSAIVEVFAKRGEQGVAVARSGGDVSRVKDKYPGMVRGDTADLTSRLEVDELWGRIDAVGTPRWADFGRTGGGGPGGNQLPPLPVTARYAQLRIP